MLNFYFSNKQGHSQMKSVKLLGREQRIDFHYNQTTPYQKACGFFCTSLDFSFASRNFDFYYKQHLNQSENTPRGVEIISL